MLIVFSVLLALSLIAFVLVLSLCVAFELLKTQSLSHTYLKILERDFSENSFMSAKWTSLETVF